MKHVHVCVFLEELLRIDSSQVSSQLEMKENLKFIAVSVTKTEVSCREPVKALRTEAQLQMCGRDGRTARSHSRSAG